MAMELLWYGGHNPDMFEEPERTLELFHCGICLMVCKDMVETRCGHVFCEDCLHSWWMNKKVCPIDRTPLSEESDYYPMVSMRRHIQQFTVRCPKDCGLSFQLKELQEHIELRCPNTEEIKYEDFVVWKGLKDFPSEDEFAVYLRRSLKKGMMLRAIENYEKVKKGDYGIFIQYNEGKPPCQVRWQNFGHKYWLPWKSVEIAELTSKNAITKKREIMEEIEKEKLLRRRLKAGAKVMAVSTFQSVCQGDIGEFVQYNEKYPPVQVRWEGYGNTYWVFWKSLVIVDGMSDEEIRELKLQTRPVVSDLEEKEDLDLGEMRVTRNTSFRRLEDFDCELDYANYMKNALKSGMLVRTVRDYEQVKRGDVGRFEQSNGNYPPCQVRWTRFGHKYWVYWKDLEIVNPLDDTQAKLENSIKHEKDLRKRLKPGSKVVAIRPYRCVVQGDIGEFLESNEKYPPVKVNWKNFGGPYWVFWDNIAIIDDMTEGQIKKLLEDEKSREYDDAGANLNQGGGQLSPSGEFKTMADFGIEVDYAAYMQERLESGMILRAVRDYEQVRKGDMGMYLQHNKNYPPVQVRWRNFGHNYWFFWRDLEIVAGPEADSVEEVLKVAITYEEELKSQLSSGIMVMSTASYQCISQGDVGKYLQHNERYPPCQVRWKHYGDPYWTFWKDLIVIEGMSDEEIVELKRKYRPMVEDVKVDENGPKGLTEFDCEAEYVDWIKGELIRRQVAEEDVTLVAVNSFGSVKTGDVGTYVKHNISYPPCLVKFDRINKKKWCYWRDLRLL